MQFQGYIYTPVPFLYIYGRYTLHFFGNDSSPISPNVRPSVCPKVTNLDITSFVHIIELACQYCYGGLCSEIGLPGDVSLLSSLLIGCCCHTLPVIGCELL